MAFFAITLLCVSSGYVENQVNVSQSTVSKWVRKGRALNQLDQIPLLTLAEKTKSLWTQCPLSPPELVNGDVSDSIQAIPTGTWGQSTWGDFNWG